MFRISRLTDYATVILAALAQEPEHLQTAAALAEQTRLSLPTVSKLLKQLQRAALVSSTRRAPSSRPSSVAPRRPSRSPRPPA